MLIRQLIDAETHTYTYLLYSRRGSEAIIMDPVKKHVDQYLTLLTHLDLTLKYAIDTHLHADHITGCGLLKNATHCLTLLGEAEANYSNFLSDGEKITIQDIELLALHTPGHTQESYCFYTGTSLFTGDTLCIGSTGRTDFQGGSALSQYSSIFNKLLCLPDETTVFPGHDYHGMTASTLYEEKHFNPRLQVPCEEAYVLLMNGLHLPLPQNIEFILSCNRRCGLE